MLSSADKQNISESVPHVCFDKCTELPDEHAVQYMLRNAVLVKDIKKLQSAIMLANRHQIDTSDYENGLNEIRRVWSSMLELN